MRKLLYIVILLLLIPSFISSYDFVYRPRHVLTNSYDIMEDQFDEIKGFKGAIEFYLIGWSDDGKIAYIESDSGWQQRYRLVIQDLITDKIIYQDEFLSIYNLYENATRTEANKLLEEYYYTFDSPEFYYRYKQTELDQVLQKYSIVQSNETDIHRFPLLFQDSEINAQILFDSTPTETKEPRGNALITDFDYRVSIHSDEKEKAIHTAHWDEYLYSMKAIGYLKSPFENRIAVIVSYCAYLGFEPEPLIWFKIYGCELPLE